MKNVFLVGDSIRCGFCETVKRELADIANVTYPDVNCQFTQYTYVHIADWACSKTEPEKVDLVYWNNGHWDAVHWLKEDESLNTPEEYSKMLRRLIRRMHSVFPNAEIVFFTSTHLDDSLENMAHPRSNAELDALNAAARIVMEEAGIPVSDICAFADSLTDQPKFADGIHFTPECFEKIGHYAAEEIRERITKK